jgi:uncharacterized protein (DUF58 family)
MNAQVRAHAARLRLVARRLVARVGGGSLPARRRGLGCEFLELREYNHGDDVRRIDWKGSARVGKFLIREYYEDARRTVSILYDRSSSMASVADAARACALLIFYAAEQAGDAVGLVAFDSQASTIAPSMRPAVQRRIEKELCIATPSRLKKTSFQAAAAALNRTLRHRSLVCIVSDGIDLQAAQTCMSLARHHEVVFFRVHDTVNNFLADHIYSDAEDPETAYCTNFSLVQGPRTDSFFTTQQKMMESNGVVVCPVVASEAAYETVIRCFMRRRAR